VASILVYIESDGETPGCAFLKALGEARRMVTHPGASHASAAGLIARLARDRVLR
jgi:hypothetical protein